MNCAMYRIDSEEGGWNVVEKIIKMDTTRVIDQVEKADIFQFNQLIVWLI